MREIDATSAATGLRSLTETWAAAELRSDAPALRSILSDDFVCVGPLGFVIDREQYLRARLTGDLKHTAFDWESLSVRAYDGFAVLVGTQSQASTYQGRDASGQFRVTQVARRTDQGWRIIGLHLCRIAPPPGTTASEPPEPRSD